ncbi:thermonuclease family protein [Roseibium sp.]|uniref:thermonuclease family protein n=1 Tax=Roseibium sp. TaxID=1936156 RepID=UPI003A986C3F
MALNLRPFAVPALLIGLSGAAVAWLLIAEPPAAPEAEPSVPAGSFSLRSGTETFSDASGNSSREDTVSANDAGAVPLPSDIRNVSPEGISAPVVTAPLTRIEPSERYLELKDPPVEPLPPGPIELKRPQVVDAGTLRTKDLTVRIAHITAPSAEETCVSRRGGTWPCGARARTSLRGLIRIFTVTCEKVADLGPREISALCSRRNTDIGAWLVEYGWADPAEGAPESYKELAAAAQDKKIGKWQAEWLEIPLSAADGPETPEVDLEGLLPEGSDPESWLGSETTGNPFDLPSDAAGSTGSDAGAPIVGQGLLQPLPPPD